MQSASHLYSDKKRKTELFYDQNSTKLAMMRKTHYVKNKARS